MDTSSIEENFQEPVRSKGCSKCPNHKQKDVYFVCVDCQTLMCTTCGIKSFHKPHNLEELSEVAAQKTVAMHEFVNHAENNTLPQLKLDMISTNKQMEENGSKFKELCIKIKSQGDLCKKEIDGVVLEWTSVCEEMERVNMELLSQQKKMEQNRYDVLFREVEDCKRTLQTGSQVDMYDAEFDTQVNDPFPTKPVLQEAKFYPGETITYYLKYLLGTFTATNYELLNETTMVDKVPFTQTIRSIHPTDDGHALIIPKSNTCEMLLLDRKGQVKQTIQHDAEITDVCRCPTTKKIWFCSQDTVYAETSTLPVERFKVDNKALSLCITHNQRIVVGTLDRLTVYTSTGLVLYTTNNKKAGIHEPVKITECADNGKLAVVNHEEKEHVDEEKAPMCIIVYDRKLKFQFTYRGYDILDDLTVLMHMFHPETAVYDSYCNLVVADWKRNTIELISGSGQHIKTLYKRTGQQGAIGLEPGNLLWSQIDGGDIEILKYYKD